MLWEVQCSTHLAKDKKGRRRGTLVVALFNKARVGRRNEVEPKTSPVLIKKLVKFPAIASSCEGEKKVVD
jgi:hypothetical protein